MRVGRQAINSTLMSRSKQRCKCSKSCAMCADIRATKAEHKTARQSPIDQPDRVTKCTHDCCRDGYWADGSACSVCNGYGYY